MFNGDLHPGRTACSSQTRYHFHRNSRKLLKAEGAGLNCCRINEWAGLQADLVKLHYSRLQTMSLMGGA